MAKAKAVKAEAIQRFTDLTRLGASGILEGNHLIIDVQDIIKTAAQNQTTGATKVFQDTLKLGTFVVSISVSDRATEFPDATEKRTIAAQARKDAALLSAMRAYQMGANSK